MKYDVAVIGLGAMGSAAACHLARRGLKVLGLERFGPAHDRGSSHGESRIIRLAYWEHPDYVPLLRRAYALWAELEQETEQTLFRRTGGLMIGSESGDIVRGALESARQHGLQVRVLRREELARTYPAFRPRDDEVGVFEAEAGVLAPEACVRAHLARAAALGAELRFGARVELGGPEPTLDGRPIPADRLVLTAGAWLASSLKLPLTVERVAMFWFEPRDPALFEPDRFPIFIWDTPGRAFYGFPISGGAVKVAAHHSGVAADPDRLDREVRAEEVEAMRAYFSDRIPALDGRFRSAAVCMYTNTPEGHFAIGPLPGRAGSVFASACSGHGFKFSPVIGEILADLVTRGRTDHPIGRFSPDRF